MMKLVLLLNSVLCLFLFLLDRFCEKAPVILMRICPTANLRSAVRICIARVKCCVVILYSAKYVTSLSASCRTSFAGRVALLYVVTFSIILPVLFHNVRHSAFYLHPNKTVLIELMKNANLQRIAQAERYFSMLNSSGKVDKQVASSSIESAGAINVALTIITVSRNRDRTHNYKPKFLTQTVWKFHSLLEKWRLRSERVHIQLSVCNVDPVVALYREAHNLSQFVPMFSRFNDTHFSWLHPLEKEKQDYVFCLNKSLEVHDEADYVFLVEDDALPTDDIFDVLQQVLLMHAEQSFVRGEFHSKPADLAFVKFFHPERLLNFVSLQPERLPELLSYAVLLSTLLTFAYTVSCGSAASGSAATVHLCWIQLFLFSSIVMLACGRTAVSEWRRLASPHFYSYTTAPSCCTPALLFPRSSARRTVDYLNDRTCRNNFGKDSLLDRMQRDLLMTSYLVQPNTFTHIGFYSSLRQRIVDPYLV